MRWLVSGSVLLVAVFASLGKPASERERITPDVLGGGLEYSIAEGFIDVVAGVGQTDFECMNPTAHESLCWEKNGIMLCADAVEIVTTSVPIFGERSLSPQANCISEEDPRLLLTLDPPPTNLNLWITQHPLTERDRPAAFCWLVGTIIGDESTAIPLIPPDPMPPNTAYGFGVGSGVGIAACRVWGVLDNVQVY